MKRILIIPFGCMHNDRTNSFLTRFRDNKTNCVYLFISRSLNFTIDICIIIVIKKETKRKHTSLFGGGGTFIYANPFKNLHEPSIEINLENKIETRIPFEYLNAATFVIFHSPFPLYFSSILQPSLFSFFIPSHGS